MTERSPRRRAWRWTSTAVLAAVVVGGLAVPAGAATPTPSAASTRASGPTTLATVQADGAAAIAQRETQLGKLTAKLAAEPACDAGGAQAARLPGDASGLTALGAKLAADTDVATAKNDLRSIFDDYRIYLVVTPQVFTLTACGHIRSATDQLVGIEATLTTRVDAAAAAGKDMTAARADLADMTAKIASARSAGDAAASSLSGIVPDRGDQSVLASNQAAVAAARAGLTGAHGDLTTAVTDGHNVVAALKAA